MPTNLYGPNDNFDLLSSHVLPALLRKAHEAKKNGERELVVWGSGKPRREFLHVDDLAAACVFLLEKYDSAEIINVGCGEDISIRELAELICEVVGFQGDLTWDTTKPDGTPRKLLDVSKLHDLGWRHSIGLREGIARTYEWFLQNARAGRSEMKTLRVGVVGVGHIGKNHARLYAELPGAQFTAIYDTDQATRAPAWPRNLASWPPLPSKSLRNRWTPPRSRRRRTRISRSRANC